MPSIIGPDDLSQWEAAPPAARARGSAELIRRFDSAEAALEFLSRQAERSPKAAPLRPARRLAAGPRGAVETRKADLLLIKAR